MPSQDVGTQLLADGDAKAPQNLKTLEETMQLPRLPQSQGDGNDVKSRFWATYTREATEFDGEFLEKYRDDMDIVLIFAGLFSAVNTSFIVNMQSNLNPDPFLTTNALLGMLLQTANSSFVPQSYQPYAPAPAPSSLVIWIQSLIYASLCASLLAALGAVLGKQWLSNFKRFGRGTIDARGRQRQMKLDGLRTWHFDSVLEFLPSLLQISLLLFGIALSASMWTMSSTIAIIIIASTMLGFTFYLTIVLASLMAADCPFQTPGSIALRSLGQSVLDYYPSLHECRQNFSKACLSFVLYIPFKIISTLKAISQRLAPSVSFALETDAPCIRWIIESSSDPDIITTAASFVPEVEWPPELDISTLLLQLFDTFLSCFENTHHEQLMIVPLSRERAIACGKAFLHLYIERMSFRNSEDSPFPIAAREEDVRKLIWVHHSDHEISFICYLVFEVLNKDSATRIHQPDIPDTFLCWMSHPLLHRLKDSRYSSFWHDRALDAIARILVNPLPPKYVLANCFMAGRMLLGQIIDRDATLMVTKSPTEELGALLEHMKQESRAQSRIVLRLLEPLGVVLELEEYRRIANHRRVAEWGLEVCETLVRTTGQTQDAQDAIWDDARTVLHFTAIVAGGPVYQSDAELVWHQRGSSIQEPPDCGWLIDYIIHYHNSDHTTVTEAMITLSQLPHIIRFNQSKTPAIVEVIVSSLALEKPTTLQDAALRAAHSCRKIIASSGDIYMPAHLLSGFSAALYSTLIKSDSPRQHLLCLQILYSWAKSEAWSAHILGHGHHSSHLAIVNTFPYPDDPDDLLLSEHLALYIIANLQVMQGLSDHPLDLPNANSCQILVKKAWHFLVVRQTASSKETVEHLSAFTKDRLHEGMVFVTNDLVSSVGQIQLRLGTENRSTSVVNDLLLNITTPQDSHISQMLT